MEWKSYFLRPGGLGGMYNMLDIGTQLHIIFKYKLQNAMRKHTISVHNTQKYPLSFMEIRKTFSNLLANLKAEIDLTRFAEHFRSHFASRHPASSRILQRRVEARKMLCIQFPFWSGWQRASFSSFSRLLQFIFIIIVFTFAKVALGWSPKIFN